MAQAAQLSLDDFVRLAIAEKLAAFPKPAVQETKRLFHEVADLALQLQGACMPELVGVPAR